MILHTEGQILNHQDCSNRIYSIFYQANREEFFNQTNFLNLTELELFMKVNGWIINLMDLVEIFILLEDYMRDHLLQVCQMVMEDLLMQMVIIIRDRLNMVEVMVREFMWLMMWFIKDFLEIMCCMEKVRKKVVIISFRESINMFITE